MFENEVLISSIPNSKNPDFSIISSKSEAKMKNMKNFKKKDFNNDGIYNQGRWSLEEHEKFLEAIFKYGNRWKKVQSHIGTRNSTQARSHAQKFFCRLKNKLHNNKIKIFNKFEKKMDLDIKAKYERIFLYLKNILRQENINYNELIKNYFSFNNKNDKIKKIIKKNKIIFRVEKINKKEMIGMKEEIQMTTLKNLKFYKSCEHIEENSSICNSYMKGIDGIPIKESSKSPIIIRMFIDKQMPQNAPESNKANNLIYSNYERMFDFPNDLNTNQSSHYNNITNHKDFDSFYITNDYKYKDDEYDPKNNVQCEENYNNNPYNLLSHSETETNTDHLLIW